MYEGDEFDCLNPADDKKKAPETIRAHEPIIAHWIERVLLVYMPMRSPSASQQVGRSSCSRDTDQVARFNPTRYTTMLMILLPRALSVSTSSLIFLACATTGFQHMWCLTESGTFA